MSVLRRGANPPNHSGIASAIFIGYMVFTGNTSKWLMSSVTFDQNDRNACRHRIFFRNN